MTWILHILSRYTKILCVIRLAWTKWLVFDNFSTASEITGKLPLMWTTNPAQTDTWGPLNSKLMRTLITMETTISGGLWREEEWVRWSGKRICGSKGMWAGDRDSGIVEGRTCHSLLSSLVPGTGLGLDIHLIITAPCNLGNNSLAPPSSVTGKAYGINLQDRLLPFPVLVIGKGNLELLAIYPFDKSWAVKKDTHRELPEKMCGSIR